MQKIIHTASGRTKALPEGLDPAKIAGLDEEGRIVIDEFNARERDKSPTGERAFLFGLTLCCNAYDKGVENGVVCRGCYSDDDVGHYLYKADDGTFPGLDLVTRIA